MLKGRGGLSGRNTTAPFQLDGMPFYMLYAYGWFLEGEEKSRYAKEFALAEPVLARVKQLLLSEALRGTAGDFQPLKDLQLPEYFRPQPAPQPIKLFAPPII
ncbi:hypothetical protein FOA52_005521 [Chlamydomonas sp. UWO 241]|nr:hypothetical protein FOA52_005521 [Chlamydomonas sp. UWO 241]